MDEALKPCPFCGGEAVSREYDERNPYEPFGLIIAHAEDCFLALHSSYDEYETRWNTRADAAPTPKADEIQAVGFAMWKAEADRAAPNVGKNRAIENYRYDLDPTSRAKWDQIAQAAIAALDAARSALWRRTMNEVEAAAKAHCDYFGGEGWWDTGLIADTKPKALDAMRTAIAALNAARGDVEPDCAVDAWLAECTDGRVSDHTIKMLKTFSRWAHAHPPRGDQVARVVEWLRNGGGTDISQLNGSMQMLFLKGMNRYADAIERGEPFNG